MWHSKKSFQLKILNCWMPRDSFTFHMTSPDSCAVHFMRFGAFTRTNTSHLVRTSLSSLAVMRRFALWMWCLVEVLHVQVVHLHVPCSLGQSLSLRHCSRCLGVASKGDLGSHAEIVQDCFHILIICASSSKLIELAFSDALRMRILQLSVHSDYEPVDHREH